MAIRPPELWNRLPSVSELLEKPPVRALADRWNRSAVAGGVRSFLEELRNDLRERAADLPLPSIRELAERAARYVVTQQQRCLGVAVNATGRLWGSPWQGRPLADAALERMVATGREFVLDGSAHGTSNDLETLLCRSTGAESAVVVHSYSGALWLATAALAAEREVLVGRAEIDELGLAQPLPMLLAAAGARLREVGTTSRATAADYEAAASPNAAVILKLMPEAYRIVGDTATAELHELVSFARDRRLVMIDAVGVGPLVDPPQPLPWPQRSVQASVAAGVNLVLVRGDGLIGGPACGIVVGRNDAVRRIMAHPLCAAFRLDPLRTAALVATLECQSTAAQQTGVLPTWQLITTPVENLRNRAERLAAQLVHVEGVASAEAVETRSQVFAAIGSDGDCASYGVALIANDGDIQALDGRLRGASPPIIGRIEGNRVVLDLRAVLPRQDKIIVDALLGPPANMGNGPLEDEQHPGSTNNVVSSGPPTSAQGGA